MCGRYTLKDHQAVAAALARLGVRLKGQDRLPQRFNAAPTQTMPVVKSAASWTVTLLRWGHAVQFGPHARPQLLINARSETAARKPTFRSGLQERRCIVPADGFFEWLRAEGGREKMPFHIHLKPEAPFWIAGIFWPDSDVQPEHYIVLTTAPNKLMAEIHDRMPVILDDEAAREWLTPGPMTPARVGEVCASYPAERMTADPVSSLVNNAKNDSPECVVPVTLGGVRKPISPGQSELF